MYTIHNPRAFSLFFITFHYFFFFDAFTLAGCAFFTIFVFITYHSAPVIHTEEQAPQIIPTISGSANSLIELTPMINNTATITNVVREVQILLVKVLVIHLFTSVSSSSVRFFVFISSRILSKITIVALIEYPTMVSIHAMKVFPTEILAIT